MHEIEARYLQRRQEQCKADAFGQGKQNHQCQNGK